mgnify:CR=1 FL=1
MQDIELEDHKEDENINIDGDRDKDQGYTSSPDKKNMMGKQTLSTPIPGQTPAEPQKQISIQKLNDGALNPADWSASDRL